MTRFQRPRDGEEQRVSPLELFYDLVFVFAITQVSHLLLDHLTWEGLGQAVIALLVVWWAWNYTAWATNELDPESIPVRLLMIAIMLASLLLAVAIPDAFGERAPLFAGAYVAIQLGRTAFLAFVAGTAGSVERRRAARILIWFAASAVLWIAGALAEGEARALLWVAALVIDYGAPLVVFWVPGLGRYDPGAWQLETHHFAERFQLFVIIALGESIVLTGDTTSELDLDGGRLAAFAVALLTTTAMWWLYFNSIAGMTARLLERAEDTTTAARDGYTYLHVVMIAGIIGAAVAQELVIAHPDEELHGGELAVVVGAPALYLLAHAAFRLRFARTFSPRRIGGAAGCVAAALLAGVLSALGVAIVVLAVLAAVLVADHVAAERRRAARAATG